MHNSKSLTLLLCPYKGYDIMATGERASGSPVQSQRLIFLARDFYEATSFGVGGSSEACCNSQCIVLNV